MSKSRFLGKAKQHFFMEASMQEVVDPVSDDDLKSGAGTRVVITIGPACQDVETLSQMLLAGVACARLDLTWGSLDFHRTSLQNLALAMRATKRLCAVWIDTVGREIIVRMPAAGDNNGWAILEKSPIKFESGSRVVITTDPNAQASPSLLPVNTPFFPSLVQSGQILHVGRFLATGAEGGSLFLKVEQTTETEIHCTAQNDASLVGLLCVLVSHREYELASHRHDLNREIPLMTEHDITCITTLGKEFEIDFVSLSYCNSVDDISHARTVLADCGLNSTKIIAKVERKAAIHNFDSIISMADGVLFSRGNLGLDFEPEEMALLQKNCILRCNYLGKPIILTRFVDTMVNTPRPTRAEATDVANAVLDGGDGILLGAETVRGAYPVDTARTVMRLCRAAEDYFDFRSHYEDLMFESFEEGIGLDRSHPSSGDFAHGRGGSLTQARPYSSLRPIATSTVPLNQGENGSAFGNKPDSQPDGLASSSHTAPASTTAGDSPTSSSNDLGYDVASPSAHSNRKGPNARTSSFGVLPVDQTTAEMDHSAKSPGYGAPFLSKVESIASSAVRTAEKINAGLLIVLTETGRTVSLVAKYRPPMPTLAVVIPTLKSKNGLSWQLEGKYLARQCMILRGVRPLLAAPMANGQGEILNEAVATAFKQGLVKKLDYVVAILSSHKSLIVKVAQVNSTGTGVSGEEGGPMGERPDRPGFATPPTSPKFLSRPSMSLAGAGTFGANNKGNPMVATPSMLHRN